MRISASSYSNTAPLIWSFLYGSMKGRVEIILDNAPSRSAALLAEDRVDAALVPVILYKMVRGIHLHPGVCVGSRSSVRSVCLVTRGQDLRDTKKVALDTSSKTSVALTKILFREFFAKEPQWIAHEPSIESMLDAADCALLIGDPALTVGDSYRKFDIVEVWKSFTGLGFVFAMWMSRNPDPGIDFAGARDEGLEHIDEIIANYHNDIGITDTEMRTYLTSNITYEVDKSMQEGMDLYFSLVEKLGLANE